MTLPTATVHSDRSTIRAFTPGHVVLATFFGSPIAGGVLLYINGKRAGQANAMWILGPIALTVVLLMTGLALPDGIGNAMALVGVVAMLQAAKMQEPKLGQTVKASGWAAFGIGIASLVVIFGAIVGYIVLDQPPSITTAPGHEIQYNRGATEAEARLVGETLETLKVLKPGHDSTIRVGHDHGDITVSIILGDDVWDQPETIAGFKAVRDRMATALQRDVIVQLCNDTFDVHRTIR